MSSMAMPLSVLVSRGMSAMNEVDQTRLRENAFSEERPTVYRSPPRHKASTIEPRKSATVDGGRLLESTGRLIRKMKFLHETAADPMEMRRQILKSLERYLTEIAHVHVDER